MSSTNSKGPRRKQRRDGAFTATDAFGGRHKIEMYTELLADGGDGPRTFLTSDGESVERVGKGHFRIVQGGANSNLRSDDPAAA